MQTNKKGQKRAKRTLGPLLAVFLLLTPPVFTQNYPVTAFVNFAPPHTSYIPEYVNSFNNQFKVLLTFNDFNEPSFDVKLRFTFTGSGYTIATNPNLPQSPVTITPGIPTEISGSDLAPYLSIQNLVFQGIDKVQYQNTKTLPEGPCEICVEVVDANNIQTLLAPKACVNVWFSLYDPPLLNTPFCDQKVDVLNPQTVLFTWTPLHMSYPGGVGTEYKFELFEMPPEETNPNVVVTTSLPIYTTYSSLTLLNYGILEPALQIGYSYAWRIRAEPLDGSASFRNNGYSQPCVFKYGDLGEVLSGDAELNLQANGTGFRQGTAYWTTEGFFDSYVLEVRKTGNPNYQWFPYESETKTLKINSLEPQVQYECRVKGIAGNFESGWSNKAVFTTLPAPDYACNSTAMPPLQQNFKPLMVLNAGTFIQVGQFEVFVTSAQPSPIPGYFTGYGTVNVPFMATVLTVQFNNILIDENHTVRQGTVQALSQGMEQWISDKTLEDAQQDAHYYDQVDSVSFDKDVIIVYLPDGTTDSITFTQSPTIIRDASGVEYRVYSNGRIEKTSYFEFSEDNLAASAEFQMVFEADETQRFGFDAFQTSQWSEHYEFIKLSDESNYVVPWKSLLKGESDKVKARLIVSHAIDTSLLRFETKNGNHIPYTAQSATEFTLQIPGFTDEGNYSIYAFLKYEKLGKLNIRVFEEKEHKLVLVPLGNYNIDATQKQQELNAIFSAAGFQWQVEVAPPFTDLSWDLNNDNKLQAGETSTFSNYSSEMRALRDAYFAANPDFDKSKYLVFVVPAFDKADIEGEMQGYMVRGKKLGFIAQNTSSKTLPHELGHGAYGLKHTFDEVPQESTNNLMDYASTGKHLAVHQWDLMRSWVPVVSFLDEEEDAAYSSKKMDFICIAPEALPFLQNQLFYDADDNVVDLGTEYIPYCFSGANSSSVSDIDAGRAVIIQEVATGELLYLASGENKEGYYKRRPGNTSELDPQTKFIPQKTEGTPVIYLNKINNIKEIEILKGEQQLYSGIFEGIKDCEGVPGRDKIKSKIVTQNESQYIDSWVATFANKVKSNIYVDSELINSLSTKVQNYQANDLINLNDEKLTDKIKAYQKYNEGKRIVVVKQNVDFINRNEEDWHKLAEKVFLSAGLSDNDILITIPFIHCPALGQGEYSGYAYIMPGIHFGKNINIDFSGLSNETLNNVMNSSTFSSNPTTITQYCKGIFKHLEKKTTVYEGILQPNYSINYNVYEALTSGFDFNTKIQLYTNTSIQSIDELFSFSQDYGIAAPADLNIEIRTKLIEQLNQTNANQVVEFTPSDEYKYLFKEEFIKDYAESYINKKAFSQYNGLFSTVYNISDFPSWIEPNNNTTWNRETYEWELLDGTVYGTLDIAGIGLSFIGLDIIADGAGLIYATARGNVENVSIYGAAVIVPGGSAYAIKNFSKNFYKQSQKQLVQLSENNIANLIKHNPDVHSTRYIYKIHKDIPDDQIQQLSQAIKNGKAPKSKLEDLFTHAGNKNKQLEIIEGMVGKYNTSIDNFVTEIPKVSLPPNVTETFTDGFYRSVKTNQKVTLYRGFGAPNGYLKGGYSTTVPNATRNELAILDEWGNSLRFEAKIEIPEGQTLNIGKVEKQISSDGSQVLTGGADQVVLPQSWDYQNWVKSITDKQTGITYTYTEFQQNFPNLITK